MNRHLKTAALGAILAGGMLQGCAAVLVGGAATGAAVMHDRRTAGALVDDKRIELAAYDIKYKDAQIGKDSSIGITSYNGKVLLTGAVPSAEVDRRFAGRVAEIEGVRNVIDELLDRQAAERLGFRQGQLYYLQGQDLPVRRRRQAERPDLYQSGHQRRRGLSDGPGNPGRG